MSDDFIEDAIDSLEADEELAYILVVAKFGSMHFHKASNIPTKKHLRWMKRRFEELCDELEEILDE